MSSASASPVPCSGGHLRLVWPLSKPKQREEHEFALPDWELLSLNQWTPTKDIVQQNNFHLVHLGRRLDPESTMSLKQLGIRPGSTIYVLPKSSQFCDNTSALGSSSAADTNSSNAQQFAMALGAVLGSPALKSVMAKLKDKAMIQSLWVTCPSLRQDPMALALLQRPETLLSLLRPAGYQQMLKSHPALIHAVKKLMAAVHEEERGTVGRTSANSSSRRNGLLDSLTYHLDALSDGDEDNEEDMDDVPAAGMAASIITPPQLAAAIAAASSMTNNSGSSTGQGSSTSANPRQVPSLAANASGLSSISSTARPTASVSENGSISLEMLRQALRASTSVTSSGNPSGDSAPSNEDLSEKIANIVEMELADAELARKALQFVRGDTQAAIELILSGWKPQ